MYRQVHIDQHWHADNQGSLEVTLVVDDQSHSPLVEHVPLGLVVRTGPKRRHGGVGVPPEAHSLAPLLVRFQDGLMRTRMVLYDPRVGVRTHLRHPAQVHQPEIRTIRLDHPHPAAFDVEKPSGVQQLIPQPTCDQQLRGLGRRGEIHIPELQFRAYDLLLRLVQGVRRLLRQPIQEILRRLRSLGRPRQRRSQ